MEKRTIIILVLILILIIVFSFIFLQGKSKDKNNLTGEVTKTTEQEAEDNQDEITSSGASSGASGSSVSSSEATSSEITGAAAEGTEIQLPSDLYSVECGYYFSEYGVCTGICPSGKCVAEGRSCYCKDV